MKTILIVEDDLELGRRLTEQMSGAGFAALSADTLEDACEVARTHKIDLAIIDLKLPDGFGLDLMRDIRRENEVPIIILTALNDPTLRIRALQLGADDVINKPFWPPELLARVQARLRRPTLQPDGGLAFGHVQIDHGARRVLVSGKPVDLTRAEFDILVRLAASLGKATTRAALAAASGTEVRSLDVHVSHLRQKLGPAVDIATVWGIGYRLETGAEP